MDEFISLLAHDLRTPLTSIRGYAQLLLRRRHEQTALDPHIASGLQTIIAQSDRLGTMTSLLLDISRVRLGRVALRRGPVDLGIVTQAVIASWSETHGGELALEGHLDGLVVNADGIRVQQVIRSMLDFVSLRPGGASPPAIALSKHDGQAFVVVTDEGEPLPEGVRARLFDQLVTGQENDAGWQLAQPELYIARGVTEAHGGRLVAESPLPERDNGLRVSMLIPLT